MQFLEPWPTQDSCYPDILTLAVAMVATEPGLLTTSVHLRPTLMLIHLSALQPRPPLSPGWSWLAGCWAWGWTGLTPPPLIPQISIVELEKSQRQQELLQLKSCVPPDEALTLQLRGKPEAEPGRLHLELDCARFSLPPFSSLSPELSMNGHAAGYELCSALGRPSPKQNTPQYLASPLDQEVVPCTPSHSGRPRLEKLSGLALPDYTRLSPAKLVLRRHLSQDHAASGKAAASELHPR